MCSCRQYDADALVGVEGGACLLVKQRIVKNDIAGAPHDWKQRPDDP